MNELRFRILDLISSNSGKNYSIRQISQDLKAHYSRTYAELENLAKEGIISLSVIGKSRIPKLRFSYETIKKLAQHELEKISFLNSDEKELLQKIETNYLETNIASLTLINYKKFKGLNYFELLIIINDHPSKDVNEKIAQIFESNSKIEKNIGAKINTLLLEKEEFISKLFSKEINALREGFLEHLAFSKSEAFWQSINCGLLSYNEIPEIKTMKLSDQEIIYSLREFGFEIIVREKTPSYSKDIGIEYLIAEILSRNEPRLLEAISIIISKSLEKQNKINFRELLFLARRKNKINQLGYLLEITKKALSNKEKIREIENALTLFELFKSEEKESLIQGIKANKKQEDISKKWFIETNYSFSDFKKRLSEYEAD